MKFKRSLLMMRLVIVLLAAAAAVTLLSLQTQLKENQLRVTELQQQITEAEARNQQLLDDIEAADTEEGIKDIARNQLGLVEDGEIVFYDIGG